MEKDTKRKQKKMNNFTMSKLAIGDTILVCVYKMPLKGEKTENRILWPRETISVFQFHCCLTHSLWVCKFLTVSVRMSIVVCAMCMCRFLWNAFKNLTSWLRPMFKKQNRHKVMYVNCYLFDGFGLVNVHTHSNSPNVGSFERLSLQFMLYVCVYALLDFTAFARLFYQSI